ncbi:MAG TPA: DNA translocase FtsK [Ktedonobacteraceae bacterium]|nr:DNA translocase FtsK [Ktedonobacteraceae bacterium]
MAGGSQKKEFKRRMPSATQVSSRVSRAAGEIRLSSQNVKSTRAAQRPGRTPRGQPLAKQPARGGQGSKRGTTPNRSAATPPPKKEPGDTRFIQWVHETWRNLEPHHQQRVLSSILLGLALLVFASLTIFRSIPIFKDINKFLLIFLGWSAYLVSLGLVAYALAHLIEGIRNRRFIRWSMVIGLTCICLLLLVESRLIFGKVGVVAELLVIPLLGWPAPTGHVIILGLLLIAIIITFRISFGHVLLGARAVQRVVVGNRKKAPANRSAAPSPFLGQRPKYSRYGTGRPESSATPASAPKRQAAQQPVRPEHPPLEEEDDLSAIDFEADFDEDDLQNDINLHKQQIGQVPRGPRAVPDPNKSPDPVKGARQQPLPFNQSPNQVDQTARKQVVKQLTPLESLAPNPNFVSKPKATARTANVPAPADSESPWKLPDTTLLNHPEEVKLHLLGDDTAALAKMIQETLRSFRVEAEVRPEDISIGPTVIRFGIRPTGKPEMKMDEKSGKMLFVRDASGNVVYESRTRVSRIMALQNDLALVLEAKTIRMEAPVPGRPYVGVEIPNKNSRLVTLREVLESKEYQAAKAKSRLAIALGKDVAGQVRVGDLAKMPHLLIAGATGAGKSVMINTIIASILTQATPDDVRMLMVDPKMVELNMYNGIPHLLSPVVTEVDKVVPLLKNAISEMERRYRLFSQLNVRNLDGYRKLRAEKVAHGDTSLSVLPAIVIIIDELADLMMAAPEEVEGMICRLAQLARATGMHLVIATQRPSVDVITGLIKANIPTRISFMVSSAVDSRTIIDMGGAERLLGRGDMLYLPADAGRPERIQGAFLADDEAEKLVEYWRQQAVQRVAQAGNGGATPAPTAVEPGWEIKEEPEDEFELDDDLLDEAEEVVRDFGKASISLLQRRLRIGYSRAARLIDLLEERGIIGQAEQGGRVREVLDARNGGSDRRGGEGHTLADEAADILAEEKARNEFLRQQAAAGRPPQQRQPSDNAGKGL